VGDVANALVTLLNCNVTGTINIASGHSVQIKELASIIAKKIGKEKLATMSSADNKLRLIDLEKGK